MLLSDKVYLYIKNKINKNEYKPGTPIIEQNIQKELGVSRTPIREAISKLEKEDLLKQYPRKGAFVSTVSTKRLIEIFDIREIIEPNMIPSIINRINIYEIKKIEEELQQIKYERPFSIIKSEKTGRKVHNIILATFNNKVLSEIMERLRNEKNRGCHLVHTRKSVGLELLNQHLAILNAIEKGDANKAKNMMQKHLRTARNNLLLGN